MFAAVYYIIDKEIAKVPVSYIKKFDRLNYDSSVTYKVFWSRDIHAIQNEEDEACIQKLKNMKEPPVKSCWKTSDGERYYSAFILRVEDTLEELIASLKRKRPNLPFTTQIEDSFTTTDDETAMVVQAQKGIKKKQEAEMKKSEQAAKRLKAEEIFKAAKKSNKQKFKNLGCGSGMETEDDDDPELIPRSQYTALQSAYDFLEKEKDKTAKKLADIENELNEIKKKNEELRLNCEEINELRELNRHLQQKLLEGGCIHAATIEADSEVADDTGLMEVELGAGISIDKKIYKEINDLDHIRKFTKSLAVAIWGTTVLAGRSVKGRPCRNRNGPKKTVPDPEKTVVHPKPQQDASSKPPLTPEKLAVVTGEMRKYLMKKGRSMPDIEAELKNRNKYISDKIQDICSNIARAEARNKCI